MTAPKEEDVQTITKMLQVIAQHVEDLGGPDNCDLVIHW